MKHFLTIKSIFKKGYTVDKNGQVFKPDGDLLPTQIQNSGYKLAHISANKKRYAITIHQLVWVWFYKVDALVLNHKDGNKFNNSPENLESCSHSENNKHAYKLKLRSPLYGERSGRTPLKSADVLLMRKLHKEGWMQKDLAKRFGMRQNSVSYIVRGLTWAHI